MAKPNYQFEKRQRDLAKKAKQEEKRRQKASAKSGLAAGDAENVSGSDPQDAGNGALPQGDAAPGV